MKFEQLLQIYWTKGFLYGSEIEPFDISLTNLFKVLFGTGVKSRQVFIRRFECTSLNKNRKKTFFHLPENRRKAMNMHFSRIMSVNHSLEEILRYTIIRLYLIKSFRGRCQAIGKPSRGQRTWSNASNAFNCNTTLRDFIAEVRKVKEKDSLPVVQNYRKLKKKLARGVKKPKIIITKKIVNTWF